MKRHVLHPLWLAIGLVATILIARQFMVPDDFGIHGDSFTYNFHRLSNEQEWKDFPVKYQGKEYCKDCHKENYKANRRSPHKKLECENCHGPAGPGSTHPDEVEFMPVNTSRDLCLRCHSDLGYPGTARAELPQIKDHQHKRRKECADCHNPHDPREDVE